MKTILNRAMLNHSAVKIIYISNSGILTQRSIKILEINEGTINAFCLLRNKKRTFKFENILSAATTKTKRRVDLHAQTNQ
ncbi:hypothetical protein V7112_08435 [Bacillus sp. JJ1566]|uniref:hypothetical protein n=1 Tax=Bacillus sp. JJ1566 TaxID=3122961 RepID=UPI0030000C1B